jgi:fucose permease
MKRRAAVLERDAVTVAGYATLTTLGWFLYTLGPTVPLLRAEQETSRTLASMHNVAFAVGVIVTGLAAVPILRRIQRDGGMRLGLLLLAAGSGLLVVGSLPDGGAIAVTLTAAGIAGAGGALAVNAATAVLSDHHSAAGAAAVTEGNAVAAAAGLLAPLAVGAATAMAVTWRGAALLLGPFALIAWVLTGRGDHAEAFTATAPRSADSTRGMLPAAYWLLLLALVACLMVESGFVTWTPDLLRDRVGLGAGAAAATTSAFLAGMAAGRFTVARFSLRLATLPLFAGCVVLAAAGWALMWTASVLPVALAGLVLAGLGAAGHFPLGSVLLINASDGQPDRALGWMAVGLGGAGGAGPFVLGSLADIVGIVPAFIVIPTCLLVALLGAGLAARVDILATRPAVREQ